MCGGAVISAARLVWNRPPLSAAAVGVARLIVLLFPIWRRPSRRRRRALWTGVNSSGEARWFPFASRPPPTHAVQIPSSEWNEVRRRRRRGGGVRTESQLRRPHSALVSTTTQKKRKTRRRSRLSLCSSGEIAFRYATLDSHSSSS